MPILDFGPFQLFTEQHVLLEAGKRIKLEGARRAGARKVSLVHLNGADLSKVPADLPVYGRNGVQSAPVLAPQRELGIIIETTSNEAQAAIHLASLLSYHDVSQHPSSISSVDAYTRSAAFAMFAEDRVGVVVMATAGRVGMLGQSCRCS